jgi:iron only hydrogenase large subunit-like protein
VPPDKVWHLAVMPCFDKKLEASRKELTSHTWHGQEGDAIRDVDCVITARELLMLAESRNISFPCLPKQRLSKQFTPSFPEATINRFLFGRQRGQKRKHDDVDPVAIGTSGGYLHHVLKTQQANNPGSSVRFNRGRNPDVADYTVTDAEGKELFRAARYYGFRNIQNLVRRLKPAKQSRMPGATRKPMGGARRPGVASAGAASEGDYSYVEVMACPGGCTNGGGQIKIGDVLTLRQVGGTGIENGSAEQEVLPAQKEWLAKVDEAYWSAESEDLDSNDLDDDGDVEMSPKDSLYGPEDDDVVDGIDRRRVRALFEHWSGSTGVDLQKLLYTTFRAVESDVGKTKSSDVERVAGLAVQVGGGW